jgi:hypothetical protein
MKHSVVLSELKKNFRGRANPVTHKAIDANRCHVWWRGFFALLDERSDEYLLQMNFADQVSAGTVPDRFNWLCRYPKGPWKYDEERVAFSLCSKFRTYTKSKKERRFLSDPDFGELMLEPRFSDKSRGYWDSCVALEFLDEKEVMMHIDALPTGPTPAQRRWYNTFRTRQRQLRAELIPKLAAFCDESRDVGYDVPVFSRDDQVWEHLDPRSVSVRRHDGDRVSSVEIDFRWNCTWDDEHGFNARLKNWRYVETGSSLSY